MKRQCEEPGKRTSGLLPALRRLQSWLSEGGAEFDSLQFVTDGFGGHRTVASRRIAEGQVIASIPSSMALSASAASQTRVGRVAIEAGASEDLALWICLAHGRDNSCSSWHGYLASLPLERPDPTGWNPETLAALRGTPLPQMVNEAKATVSKELDSVLPRMLELCTVKADLEWMAVLSLDAILWARSIHLSRCFPAELCKSSANVAFQPSTSPDNDRQPNPPSTAQQLKSGVPEAPFVTTAAQGSVGCLLPLFDMLNHKGSAKIMWRASNSRIEFVSLEVVEAGDEVFNNYGGNRSNEDLLFYYGFAEEECSAQRDRVTGMVFHFDLEDPGQVTTRLRRLMERRIPCGSVGPSQSTLRVGSFEVGPLVSSAGEKAEIVPPIIMRALKIVAGVDDENIDCDDVEALALLHSSLVASLDEVRQAPLPPEQSSSRSKSIMIYRDGRQRILEACLRETESRLASFASDSEEGDPTG